MRNLFSIAFAFVIFTMCAIAQPKLVIIGGDEYNWGDVRSNQTPLKAAVQLKNEGDQDLTILSVKPSCGCTAAKPEKDVLKPGEVTAVNVEFSLGTNVGELSKTITITTDDPNRKNVIYRIKCNIIRDIISKPSQHLAYKRAEVGKEYTSTMYIKNNSPKDIKFSDMTIEPPIVKLTISDNFTLKAGEEIEVTGRLTPKEPGTINAKIRFKTDNVDNPTYEIGVYGDAVASAVFTPDATPNKTDADASPASKSNKIEKKKQ